MATDRAAFVLRSRTRPRAAEGLRRDRLIAPLTGPGAPAVALVVAPAGCGKTTLLSHVADVHRGPVAWLTLDHDLGDERVMAAHLEQALDPVLATPRDEAAAPWTGTADVLAAVDSAGLGGIRPGALVVLDDLHTVRGEPGAALVGVLLRHRPEALRLVLASRTPTGMDVWRDALRGDTTTVGADDLRFRTWEVEELLRHRRRARLRPEEVALLTRRTGGWAAGLQLFDLATSRMPPSARSRLLYDETRSGLLTRDYLMWHVVAGVPAELRGFVLRSSVLTELTPRRCAAVLECDPGEARRRLGVLASLGLLAPPDPTSGVGGYTHHDVLRSQLLAMAAAELGDAELAALHRRAGEALRTEGALAGAVRSYALAGDWDAVEEVVRASGRELAGTPGSWLDVVPASLRESDPWVAIAVARRLFSDGAFEAAAEAYRRAEALADPATWASAAREEARAIAAWHEPPLGDVDDWIGLARRTLVAPADALAALAGGRRSLGHEIARGLGLLVSGRPVAAAETFAALLDGVEVPPVVEAAALLGQAVALSLTTSPQAGVVRQQAQRATTAIYAPPLARLAEGLDLLCADGDPGRVEHLVHDCRTAGDRWGEYALRLFAAVAALPRPAPAAVAVADLAGQLREQHAPAPAVWASACQALAARAEGRAWDAAALDELLRSAVALGPVPGALARLAADRDPAGRPEPGAAGDEGAAGAAELAATRAWRRAVARGLPRSEAAGPVEPRAETTGTASEVRPLDVRCLGGFRLTRGEVEVDLAALRPRHRALLRALCLHAGTTVHRERLMGWFWPEHDPAKATRNLQVAVSAVRRVVEDGDGSARLRRHGDGYRLDLGDGTSDLQVLRARLAEVPAARAAGDPDRVEQALAAVLAVAAGEVLPDDGPAEWAVAERERVRLAVVGAAEELAGRLAASGRPAEAADTAALGLTHDRYDGGLWDRLVAGLEQAGRRVAAAEAAAQRREVVGELVGPHPRVSPGR